MREVPARGTLLRMGQLTHISATGEASMVEVSHKPAVLREAVARGEIRLAPETLMLVESVDTSCHLS